MDIPDHIINIIKTKKYFNEKEKQDIKDEIINNLNTLMFIDFGESKRVLL